MSRAEIKALSELTGQTQAKIRQDWREWRRLEMAAANPKDWIILREPNGDIRAVKKGFANTVARANRDYERFYAR